MHVYSYSIRILYPQSKMYNELFFLLFMCDPWLKLSICYAPTQCILWYGVYLGDASYLHSVYNVKSSFYHRLQCNNTILLYVLWHGSRCFRRLYPGLHRHEDTPSSVRHLSCWAASQVESSPTIHVSILTGGCVGRFQAGTDGLPPAGGPAGLAAPCPGCNTWLTEYDLCREHER